MSLDQSTNLVPLDEAIIYLRIDHTDEDVEIQGLLDAVDVLMTSFVPGHAEKLQNAKYTHLAKQFAKLILNEFYSNRSLVSEEELKLTFAAKSLLTSLRYGEYPVVPSP